jgi:hypothetical protein
MLANTSTLPGGGPGAAAGPSRARPDADGSGPSSASIRVLVEAVQHSFTPVVIQQFLALQSSLATELSVLLEAAAKISEERRVSRRRLADALGLEESEEMGWVADAWLAGARRRLTGQRRYNVRVYLAGVALRATSLPLDYPGELPGKPWAEAETGGVVRRLAASKPVPH